MNKFNRNILGRGLLIASAALVVQNSGSLALGSESFSALPLQGVYLAALNGMGAVDLSVTCTRASCVCKTNDKQCSVIVNSSLNPVVDGVHMLYDWPDIETLPVNGQCAPPAVLQNVGLPARPRCFDFSHFHDQLGYLAAINNSAGTTHAIKAILGITLTAYPASNEPAWSTDYYACPKKSTIPCPTLPKWLWQETSGFSTITSVPTGQDQAGLTQCLPYVAPIPWDQTYHQELIGLIQAFGAWAQADPNSGLIAGIQIGALSYLGLENHMPLTAGSGSQSQTCTNTNYGIALTIPDDTKNWQAAGYTPSLVKLATSEIIRSWHLAFPGMAFELEMPVLPPINSSGQIVTKPDGSPDFSSPVTSGFPIVAQAHLAMGNQLTVFEDGISGVNLPSDLLAYTNSGYGANSYSVGYFPGWMVSNDPGCAETGEYGNFTQQGQLVCEEPWAMQEVLNELQIGGANYLKLNPSDIQLGYFSLLSTAYELVHRPGSSFRFLSATAQNLGQAPWTLTGASDTVNVSSLPKPYSYSPLLVGPSVQFLQEGTSNSKHESEVNLDLIPGILPRQTYAFNIFVSPDSLQDRMIEIVANAGTSFESGMIYNLNTHFINKSWPVPAGPHHPPGAAQKFVTGQNGQMLDGNWVPIGIQFTTKPGHNSIEVKLIQKQNSTTYLDRYQGNGTSGVYLWAPQVMMLQNQTVPPPKK